MLIVFSALQAPSAVARAGGELIATAPQVAENRHPGPKNGAKLTDEQIGRARSLGSAPKELPALTEHGDATAQREGKTYTVEADNVEKTLPRSGGQLAAYDPIQDCKQQLGGQYGDKVVNHFLFCSMYYVYYDVIQSGTKVGRVGWNQITVGSTGGDERNNYFTTSLESFQREGTTFDVPGLEVFVTTGGYNGTDGTNKPCNVISSAGNPKDLKTWETTNLYAVHVVDSLKSDGYGRDFLSRCSFATNTRVTTANGSQSSVQIFVNGLRQDSASYLEGTVGGAIFDRIVPEMTYSLSSTAHGAVADHIETAQTLPQTTDPATPGKIIPGGQGSGHPLSRLYPDWDAQASAQRAANVSAKDKACAPIKPNPSTDLDCDEYPFGSTWEGPAAGPNFSVRYLSTSQNRSAGATLGNWYKVDRILHRDRFYVAIAR
ncbi:hypothetical protein EOT10_26930 [Streptomyces antnestii]|uniref:Deoxyribonuclease NucA/NucB domain-containing protein n=1 Tax=Streptomyces antnestii TaxID=2494256 RepID=A0A437PF99_9ACTN|nr:NucA/NucB deoxyribonuclease domain-containing protein [Streptomyces sp. San01]RVU20960.1 hypothetical protein EOT10_26930 [Streptomyces sp. San01]